MEEQRLREIATEYLLPLFSGAELEDRIEIASSKRGLVSYNNPQVIAFRVNKNDCYRLLLRRNQPFAYKRDPARELQVVQAFVDIIAQMETELETHLREDLLSTFQRRVVARAIGGTSREDNVLQAIDQLSLWGTRLYEGAPISSAIGIGKRGQPAGNISLRDMIEHDFVAVLSNGHDTLLEFDSDSRFVAHHVLNIPHEDMAFAPLRQAPVATWTKEDSERIALALNRLGEILIFRDGQLLFTRRSGRWCFLTHQPIVRQMGVPQNEKIRRAIYQTCLDASFARSGACIGAISSSSGSSWTGIVNKGDRLSLRRSQKSQTLADVVRGRPFHHLDRRLRQELTAIDGATIIDHEGAVLAVGAILRIPGGSTGGGRTAAARELGKLGLGIKVSQDGAIIGYRLKRPTPAFNVMQ